MFYFPHLLHLTGYSATSIGGIAVGSSAALLLMISIAGLMYKRRVIYKCSPNDGCDMMDMDDSHDTMDYIPPSEGEDEDRDAEYPPLVNTVKPSHSSLIKCESFI